MRISRSIIVAAICLLAASPSLAWARDYVSHSLDGQTLSVTTTEGTVKLTALSADAFEIVYDKAEMKQLPSFALSGDSEYVNVTVEEVDGRLEFKTPNLTAKIEKTTMRLSYTSRGQNLVSEEDGFFLNDKTRGFRFRLTEKERLWGGGQRVVGMDRRGEILPLDNRGAYGYSDRSDAMYYGVPAILSDRKYLLLFDNSARGEMDLGKTEPDIMKFEAKGGRAAYVIVAGKSYADIVKNYTNVTGKQPLPPRWAFGNMASRFGYRNEAETRQVVNKHFDDGFPLDAVILDLFWFGPDIKGHLGNLDWDRKAFPDPEAMISEFKGKGVNTILITEPFILRTSKRWDEALANEALAKDSTGEVRSFDFYFGNGGLVDMFNPKASRWFWSKNKDLLDQGVAGIWGDLGEPEAHPSDIIHSPDWSADEVHNAYGHQWARIMSENWTKTYPGQRPFLMMRSGFAGTQRYGIIPWSGDVSKSWPALKAQIEIALQMSVVGLAYSHSDLGGFVALDSSSTDPEAIVPFDKELYTRWLQFGAFQPVFRPHSQEQIPSEPVFQDKQTKDIVRRYIQTRYRLLPYLYTAAWQNSRTGMPMTRPLAFESDNPELFVDQSAFLWGDDLIVAPVTEKSARTKTVQLTNGTWFDYWTGARHQGGQEITVPVTLEDIPVFVRAGAFIPMIGDIMTTKDYRADKLSLHYYHDDSVNSSDGIMYDDDGKSAEPQKHGRFETLAFQSSFDGGILQFDLNRQKHNGYDGAPAKRQIDLVIHNWAQAPAVIFINGKQLFLATKESGQIAMNSFSYSPASRILKLRFDWDTDNVMIYAH